MRYVYWRNGNDAKVEVAVHTANDSCIFIPKIVSLVQTAICATDSNLWACLLRHIIRAKILVAMQLKWCRFWGAMSVGEKKKKKSAIYGRGSFFVDLALSSIRVANNGKPMTCNEKTINDQSNQLTLILIQRGLLMEAIVVTEIEVLYSLPLFYTVHAPRGH